MDERTGLPRRRRATAPAARTGGARGWLHELAGAGRPAAIARWEAALVAPPPTVPVYADPALNRRLYLWLAALAAYFEPRGDWIDDNLRATRRVLAALPGLAPLQAQLAEAELARRGPPATPAERLVRAALHGVAPNAACDVRPIDVAPVWFWLDLEPPTRAAPARETGTAGAARGTGPGRLIAVKPCGPAALDNACAPGRTAPGTEAPWRLAPSTCRATWRCCRCSRRCRRSS